VTAASNFREMLTEANLKESFKQFDINGDGYIQFEEFKQILGCTDEEEDELNDLIASADVNQDGQISFEEFKKMMTIFIRRNSAL
jgi:Ca2+-binding EF-hand superfamily protein